MIKLALITLMLFQSPPPPQTSFGFGAALAHAHPAGAASNVTGVFCGNQLVADPSNTTGHHFFGNTICVDSGAGPRWYWYDWPADKDAGRKLAVWPTGKTVITLRVADADCLLALSAVEGTPTSISAVAGSGVYKGTATLTATLTSGGSPLSGKTVRFTLNGSNAGEATTNPSGVATVTNVSLTGINAGTYANAVGAAFAGEGTNLASSGTGALTVNKADQAITFASPGARTFGDPDFELTATASSGLAVGFSASGNCSFNDGRVHLTGAGNCTVTASQDGGDNYNAATSVPHTFQIAKAATATAVVTSASPASYGLLVLFTATVTSAAGTPTGSVQFKVDGSNLGSPAALNASGVALVSTAGLTAGSHVVTAEYVGDANFLPSAGTLAGGQFVGGVFEFSQALFTVNERNGSVAVTVRRRGDVSQAAAVGYATDDGSIPSVPVPCSDVTGAALERCDYTRAQGLLQFAPGEVDKTFSVLVNTDSYLEGTETTRVRLSNPTAGAVLSETPSAVIDIADDTQQPTNPLSDSSFFVRQHYHDFLNREPDAAGLNFWVKDIEECGADAQCREVKRVNVSAAFFLSIEFQQTGYFVERMYKAAYGDATDTSTIGGTHTLRIPGVRLQEFLPDTQQIGQGVVVGEGDWEGRLAANKQSYGLEFVGRSRFTSAFPLGMSADEFVRRLNDNVGGVLSDAERAALLATLGANPNDTSRRAQVLRAVAENPAFTRAESNRAFVLMQYFGYLRRNINSAPDADSTGYEFWLGKLNEFGGDFIQAEMVRAFLASDEYRRRFGQ